jgi:hypothetical protein
VLVAVDDAQWLDRPSLDALVFAACRVEREVVSLLVAVRSGSAASLVDSFALGEARRIELGGWGFSKRAIPRYVGCAEGLPWVPHHFADCLPDGGAREVSPGRPRQSVTKAERRGTNG